jgi:alpha-N-arabinofuranosidase
MDVETLGLEPVSPPATRDDFDSDQLGLEWNFLRNPLEGAIRPDREPGRLTLEARGKSLSSPEATMAARRQQHPYCKATCLITDVEGAGEAGLTAFMDQEHHCEIFVRTTADGREVVVRGRSGTLEAELARRALPGRGAVELWIRADPRWYRFGYACGEESESEIAATETRHLSVELTWSFTGTYFGLYCVSPGEARAAFDWFEYLPDHGRTWVPSMDRG